MIIGGSKIGMFPGIGLMYGTETKTFTVDVYVQRKNVTETFTIDTHLATPSLTKTFTTDVHIMIGTYTKTFTIDAILERVKNFTIDAYIVAQLTKAFTSDVHICTTGLTKTFTADTILSIQQTKEFTLDAYLQKTLTKTFTSDIHLANTLTKAFTEDVHIATALTKTFTSDVHIAALALTKAFTADVNIANYKAEQFTIDAILFYKPYYVLNSYNITNHIYDPTYDGLENKISKFSIADTALNSLKSKGLESLSYKFDVLYLDPTENDTFLASINSLVTDCIFYPGRSDWYHRVKHVSVSPVKTIQVRYYKNRVRLDLEDPFLYNSAQTYVNASIALPATSTTTFSNHGNADAPLYSLAITGYYSGDHTTSIYYDIMNGATAESSMIISDRLLSDEVATLDVDGDLTCVYTDDFSSGTDFLNDKYASSSATVTGGNLVISSGGYVTYKLYGPHPLKENIKLTSTISYTGSPYIQVSNDNSSWSTAVRTSDLVSATSTDYYLSGSEKYSDVYVRFYCPAGSTMTIATMTFTASRDTSYYDLPHIDAGASRTVRVRGSGSSIAGINIEFRSRKWPA